MTDERAGRVRLGLDARPRPRRRRARDREPHRSATGWDQPARLYALVTTAQLVEQGARAGPRDGPRRGRGRGLADPGRAGPARRRTSRWSASLESITWPAGVAGCAAVVERLVLPPDADAAVPEDPDAADGVRPRAPRAPGGPDRGGRHPRRGRRTVPCGCAPPTTTSRCWRAPTWCRPAGAAARHPGRGDPDARRFRGEDLR